MGNDETHKTDGTDNGYKDGGQKRADEKRHAVQSPDIEAACFGEFFPEANLIEAACLGYQK